MLQCTVHSHVHTHTLPLTLDTPQSAATPNPIPSPSHQIPVFLLHRTPPTPPFRGSTQTPHSFSSRSLNFLPTSTDLHLFPTLSQSASLSLYLPLSPVSPSQNLYLTPAFCLAVFPFPFLRAPPARLAFVPTTSDSSAVQRPPTQTQPNQPPLCFSPSRPRLGQTGDPTSRTIPSQPPVTPPCCNLDSATASTHALDHYQTFHSHGSSRHPRDHRSFKPRHRDLLHILTSSQSDSISAIVALCRRLP